ncbi:MAG TPA: magnesium transporter [Eubacteriaceae bacterium]|nr:magnesium transporter [Eubacteriaceae bacterium]
MIKRYAIGKGMILNSDARDSNPLWIHMIDPDEEEVDWGKRHFGLKSSFVYDALDVNETSRMEVGEGQLRILINIPYKEEKGKFVSYNTVPLGMVLTERTLFTVTLRENEIVDKVAESKRDDLTDKVRLMFHMMNETVSYFLKYLKEIENESTVIEDYVNKSLKNEELIKLLHLEQSLVFFSTALRSNETVLQKCLDLYNSKEVNERSNTVKNMIKISGEHKENFKEVMIESRQAIALIDIYTNTLSNTMDVFASMISNNLNIVMKFLTIVTITLAVPAIVTSYYGMNIYLPFQDHPYMYLWIIVLSFVIAVVVAFLIGKKKF